MMRAVGSIDVDVDRSGADKFFHGIGGAIHSQDVLKELIEMAVQMVEFKCKIGDMVKLRGNDVTGVGTGHVVGEVVGLWIDEDQIHYILVRYTDVNNNRQHQWFRYKELIL